MSAISSVFPRAATDTKTGVNPWIIAVTVTLATFMELLDTSIANVALPHIAGGLAVSYDESTWVLTSYLVSNAVVLPLSAWLSRVFGRKNYYMTCVALFVLSSMMCGLAPSLGMLVFFRVLQGIGGGGLAPVEQAILVDTFPPERRPAAIALYSMAIVTAPAIGPPLGGWITDNLSWRWVFFINIPVGIVSLLMTKRVVQDPPAFTKEVAEARASGKLKIDYIGIALVALGFGCLEVVMDRGQRLDWLESQFITTFLAVAIVSLVIAIVWELKHDDPVVDLQLLRNRNFAISCAVYFIFGFTLFGSTVLIPQMLESLYGYTATDAGLVLGPGAMVIVVLAPVIVRLVKKISPAKLLGIGFSIMGLAMWHFAGFNLAADYKHEVLARALQGLGIAFLFVPNTEVAYSFLPLSKNNKASSLTNLFRNQGGSIGIAFVTTLLERRTQYHHSVLAAHVHAGSIQLGNTVGNLNQLMISHGASGPDGLQRVYGLVSSLVDKQAAIFGFLDCFWMLGIVAFSAVPLTFFIRKFQSKGGTGAH